MTFTQKLTASAVTASMVALSLGSLVLPAQAQTVNATVSTSLSAKQSARMQTDMTKGDADIDARITSLNNLNTRIQAMKNVSASEKSNISADVQTNINGLTTLKAKIAADTDEATLSTDTKSIFGTFRIYALVVPQGYMLSASDRIATIGSMLTAINAKFTTRITAEQSAGHDVTALLSAQSDMTAQIADAEAKAQLASNGVASLTPDQGNKTVAASNKAALLAARANLKTSTADLKAARADAKTIISDLKAMKVTTTTTTTTQ